MDFDRRNFLKYAGIAGIAGGLTLANARNAFASTVLTNDYVQADDIKAPTGRSATLVVAAEDSSAKSKSQADFVCDGTADNIDIQAAISELPTVGGKVQLLEGTFDLSAQIDTISNLHLAGMGKTNTILRVADGAQINGVDLLDVTGVTIENLSIDGNAANNVKKSAMGDHIQNCIHAIRSTNFTIRNTYLHDAIYHGVIMIDGCNYNSLYANRCEANGYRPIHAHNRCSYNSYINNFILGNGASVSQGALGGLFVVYDGCNYNKVIGNTIIDECTNAAIQIAGGDVTGDNLESTGNVISSNIIDVSNKTNTHGIAISANGDSTKYVTNTSIIGNIIKTGGLGNGILKQSGAFNRGIISGNCITSVRSGIKFIAGGSSDKNVITENVLEVSAEDAISVSGVTEFNISDNIISGYQYSAIAIKLVGVSHSVISHNTVHDSKYLINEDANSHHNTIIGNVGIGIGTAPYFNLLGSNDIIRDNTPYITKNFGTATIPESGETVEVTHGLAAAPTRVLLSPTTATAGRQYYVSAKDATTFTITIDSAAAAAISFDWQAVV